ncbi:uncharacterized protein DNG_08612 [Cephalotrichum gorgonifer]|uniref:Sulphur transport domain-containing protein n=1 Tax=Cephalotrichum gorgonifer TaxID=2041049 RepID=A0AAE8SYM3_9PEZI|nr:uncharacterized protein DNG_08612 [Cephalotrichum gorgonifer]
MATTLVTGAVFGAALVAAGVHDPAVVISQFKFENFDMVQSFLAATATTSAVVVALDKLGYISLKPRTASSLGLFSAYDGNVVGGSLLGAGMALSGACPGVAFTQAGLGLRSGRFAIQGALVGGVIYTGIIAPAIARRRKTITPPAHPGAIHHVAPVSRAAAFIGTEAIYAAVIASAILLGPPSPFRPLVSPAVGGVILGSAQLLSLLLRGSLIGVSTVFEDAGRYVSWLTSGADTKKAPKSYTATLFALAMTAGAYALGLAYPSVAPAEDARVTAVNAIVGGILFAIGARIAGGCTSGHGISGISLLSVSSFVTIASTFAIGGAVALWAY